MLREIRIDVHFCDWFAIGRPSGYAVHIDLTGPNFWEVFAFFAIVCESALHSSW
jgi:hypothetical protein